MIKNNPTFIRVKPLRRRTLRLSPHKNFYLDISAKYQNRRGKRNFPALYHLIMKHVHFCYFSPIFNINFSTRSTVLLLQTATGDANANTAALTFRPQVLHINAKHEARNPTEGVAPPTYYCCRNTQKPEEEFWNENKVLQKSNTETKQIQNTNRQISKQKHHHTLLSNTFYFGHLNFIHNFSHGDLFRNSRFAIGIFQKSAVLPAQTATGDVDTNTAALSFSQPVLHINAKHEARNPTEGVAPPTCYCCRNTQIPEEEFWNENKVLQQSNTETKQIQNTNRQISKQKHHHTLLSNTFCFGHLNFSHNFSHGDLFRNSRLAIGVFQKSTVLFQNKALLYSKENRKLLTKSNTTGDTGKLFQGYQGNRENRELQVNRQFQQVQQDRHYKEHTEKLQHDTLIYFNPSRVKPGYINSPLGNRHISSHDFAAIPGNMTLFQGKQSNEGKTSQWDGACNEPGKVGQTANNTGKPIDINLLTNRVYHLLEKKIKSEKERRGI